jgi:gliding motility-associated peptidyl-prolyl isomerase
MIGRSFFIVFILLVSCGGPEPRKPVKVKSGSYIKESAERNKQLLESEQKIIQELIASDSINTYYSSANGSWYYYNTKIEEATNMAAADDLVTMTYDIRTLNNDTIYSQEEIGVIKYKVDKQELFPGLRNSVKLLKEKEVATFLFPSSLAYGYHGDTNKVGTNIPLQSTISILAIEQKQDSILN